MQDINGLQKPPYLVKGDTVGIVAPARKISEEELRPCVDILKSWGLNVVFGAFLFESLNQFSGTDEQRAKDMQAMLDNPDIKAVFCARGGYGSVRIVDKIDYTLFAKNPKWLVGFSDITVFHAHINTCCGIETLHAPMPVSMTPESITEEALASLKSALFGKPLKYVFPAHPLNRKGKAQGILCGGNLSVIYSLMSSKSQVQTKNSILFIEDLDEYLYHIDRMMMCLKRANKLSEPAALIVGGMNKMNDNTIPFGKNAYDIIAESVAAYNYPVCFGFPAGHITDNRALVMGRQTTVEVNDNEVIISYK